MSYGDTGPRIPSTQDAYAQEVRASEKIDLIKSFVVPKLLDWVDKADPYRQVPITIADWHVDGLPGPLGVVQDELRQQYLESSDIITFHHYGPDVLIKLESLQAQFPGRPVVLSSFMARDNGSTLEPILGDMYKRNVWAFQCGWVSGKTQTIYNSDSWNKEYNSPPSLWHHDMLWPDGRMFNISEGEYLTSFRDIIDNNPPTKSQPVAESDSWTGSKWADTCITLVGIFGIIAIVVTGVWFCIRRKRRIRARTLDGAFDEIAHAVVEDHDLNEML